MPTKPNPDGTPAKRQLDAVLIQLSSQRPSDVWRGMEQVRQWLKEDPEDRDVYGLVLDAVKKNRDLREEARHLLTEMMQNDSQVAEEALRSLPSGIQDLLADANDAYYAAEYVNSIQLYRQVLRLDPENAHAKEHLAKAVLKRDTGESPTDLPRAAQQYFRRARSFIAIREVVTAMNLLNAAVEAAQGKGMKYPEAEEALNNIQNLVLADEQISMADDAVKKGNRKKAINYYQNALKLDPSNYDIRKKIRNQKLIINAWWTVPLFVAIVGAAVYGLSTIYPASSLATPTITKTETSTIVSPTAITLANTTVPSIAETATNTEIPIPSPTNTPKATETIASTSTESPLGIGYINKAVASVWKDPNSGLDGQLGLNQSLEILEEQTISGAKWYRCRWTDDNGQRYEGWILESNITFGPTPTPRP